MVPSGEGRDGFSRCLSVLVARSRFERELRSIGPLADLAGDTDEMITMGGGFYIHKRMNAETFKLVFVSCSIVS